MEILKYIFLAFSVIILLITLILASRTKKAFKYLLINGFFGLFVFFILYLTKNYTGIFLPLNLFTFLGSILLGVPAIIVFLILGLIF